MNNTKEEKPNTYGILYENLGPVLSSEEYDYYLKSELNQYNIELVEINRSGEITNNIEEITNVINFTISSSLVIGIINGILPNAAWDTIKVLTSKVFRKVKTQKYTKVTSNKVEEKAISFGIDLSIANDKYTFKFESITQDETMLEALDKILIFAENQINTKKLSEKYTQHLVLYDVDNMSWKDIEMMDYINTFIKNKK